MLFNSWPFVLLVLCSFIVYYLPFFRTGQVYVLIASSLVFYAYSNPWLLLLLLFSALVNAVASYFTVYGRYPRWCSVAGVVVNLSMLAFYKYSSLIGGSFFDVSDGIGAFLVSVPLPVGISFYTFQGISLVVDVWRGRTHDKGSVVPRSFARHLERTMLYITFFPQLVAGPIVKAHEFLCQIGGKSVRGIRWGTVFRALVLGYFLKMVVADNLKDFTFWMAYPYFQNRGTGSLVLMLIGYGAQIFADFAGYSLIAIGVAGLFGYSLPRNFYFPYISASFREFWKRWHISLSSFLMEYLYIPLGGNRHGRVRTYLNLLLTMMLGGLWHGAAWSYLAWGTYHGLLLAGERLLTGGRRGGGVGGVAPHGCGAVLKQVLRIGFVLVMVTMGWLFFVLPDFSHVLLYLRHICSPGSAVFLDPKLLPIVLYVLPVVIYHLVWYFRDRRFVKVLRRYDPVFAGAMLFLIVVNSGSAADFVYFQF